MGIEISKLGPDIENLFPTSFYDYFGLTKTLFRMRVVQLYIPGPFCWKTGFWCKSCLLTEGTYKAAIHGFWMIFH